MVLCEMVTLKQSVSSLACHFSSACRNYNGLYWHNKYESTGGIHFQLFNWRNERSCNMELTRRICQATIKFCNSCDLGVIKWLIKRKKFLWYRVTILTYFILSCNAKGENEWLPTTIQSKAEWKKCIQILSKIISYH